MPTEIKIRVPKLHAGQAQVLREAQRFNVLECGRRWGKTTFGVDRAVDSLIRGHRVGWFAPTYRTMTEQWREVTGILGSVLTDSNRQDSQIRVMGGGVLDMWSCDNPDSGRGRAYHRVIVDEASIIRDLEDAWNATIRPTLTDHKGDAWFLGTPKGHNFFHVLFARSGQPGWKSWRLATVDNPVIDPAEVEEARRSLPKAVFDQEYLGIPADDGGNPFDIKAIRDCVIDALSVSNPVVFGVDLAKSVDWTVLCGIDADGAVCHLERFQADWGQTRGRVLSAVNGWPTQIDSTGVGDPIVEDIQRVRPNVRGFKFTAQSKQQLMEGLAVAIHRREIRIPAGWLVDELEAFRYEYTRTGVRYSAPDGMHDDGVCALALAVSARSRPSAWVGVVEVGGAEEQDEDQWD